MTDHGDHDNQGKGDPPHDGGAGDGPGRRELERPLRDAHQRGDYEQAVVLGLELYGGEIYSFLVAMMRQSDAADEAYSDFMERVWRYIDRFQWRSSFRTWAYLLARSAFGNYYRDPQNRDELKRHVSSIVGQAERDEGRGAPLPVSVSKMMIKTRESTKAWLKTEIKDAFVELRRRVLDPDEEQILVLRVNRKMSWNDVALVMGGPELSGEELHRAADRLKHRFSTIKKKLRSAAEDEGLIPPKPADDGTDDPPHPTPR